MKILIKEELLSDLLDLFGEENVFTKEEELVQFGPEFFYPEHRPITLVRPSEIRQLNRLLIIMKRNKTIGITPRGFGNTFAAYSNGIIVDLTLLNEIVEIDESRNTATVQAGLNFNQFSEELKKKNLNFPLAPIGNGTIGGFLAFGGIQLGSYKYGSINSYLREVSLLTSKKIVKLGSKYTPPYTSGYNLTNILIGSMGIFGIIIDTTLSLIPSPELRYDISLHYENVDKINIDNLIRTLDFLKTLDSLSNLTITTSSIERAGEKKVIEVKFQITLEGMAEMVQLDNEKLQSLKNIDIKAVDNLYISDNLKQVSDNLISDKPFLISYNEFKESLIKSNGFSFILHFLSPNKCLFAILSPTDDRVVKAKVDECSRNEYFSKGNLSLIKKMKMLFDPHNIFQPGMLD